MIDFLPLSKHFITHQSTSKLKRQIENKTFPSLNFVFISLYGNLNCRPRWKPRTRNNVEIPKLASFLNNPKIARYLWTVFFHFVFLSPWRWGLNSILMSNEESFSLFFWLFMFMPGEEKRKRHEFSFLSRNKRRTPSPTTTRLKKRKQNLRDSAVVFSLGKVNVIYGVLLLCKIQDKYA